MDARLLSILPGLHDNVENHVLQFVPPEEHLIELYLGVLPWNHHIRVPLDVVEGIFFVLLQDIVLHQHEPPFELRVLANKHVQDVLVELKDLRVFLADVVNSDGVLQEERFEVYNAPRVEDIKDELMAFELGDHFDLAIFNENNRVRSGSLLLQNGPFIQNLDVHSENNIIYVLSGEPVIEIGYSRDQACQEFLPRIIVLGPVIMLQEQQILWIHVYYLSPVVVG